MKELCPALSEVMDAVIRTVNYIRTPPSKSKFCRILKGVLIVKREHSMCLKLVRSGPVLGRRKHFIFKLAYLNYIFGDFNT
jgi:hypothetical protein